jgi:transposase InsO family protein
LLGLCVLDRDDGDHASPPDPSEPGLEFFTWGRRHIESYLLVPEAIRRVLCLARDDSRIDRKLNELLPLATDESVYRQVDAKRLLGTHGALPRALGRSISLQGVARATRSDELHADVHRLFGRFREAMGVTPNPELAMARETPQGGTAN